jgi:hypothetical protein
MINNLNTIIDNRKEVETSLKSKGNLQNAPKTSE